MQFGGLDAADHHARYTKCPEHQVEFRANERTHPRLGEDILPLKRCQLIYNRCPSGTGNGKWAAYGKAPAV